VACASLFGLKHESKIGFYIAAALYQSPSLFPNSPLDLFGLMANYRVNGFRSQFEGGADKVCYERQACQFVQDLRAPGLHPRS
jgi:hypothetical protein